MVWRLIYDQCSCIVFQFLQYRRAFFFLFGRNASKEKRRVGSPDRVNAVMHAAAPGRGCHFDALFIADPHQIFARIGDTRRTRIRDQRDICPLLHLFHQLIRLVHFVIFMIAGQWCLYIKNGSADGWNFWYPLLRSNLLLLKCVIPAA